VLIVNAIVVVVVHCGSMLLLVLWLLMVLRRRGSDFYVFAVAVVDDYFWFYYSTGRWHHHSSSSFLVGTRRETRTDDSACMFLVEEVAWTSTRCLIHTYTRPYTFDPIEATCSRVGMKFYTSWTFETNFMTWQLLSRFRTKLYVYGDGTCMVSIRTLK
jgi:hypothetical protein